MWRATIGVFLVLAALPAMACGQEAIATPAPVAVSDAAPSPQKLACLGLSGLCVLPDEAVDCLECRQPPVSDVVYIPPPIFGERQLYTLTHGYVRDPLPRKAWRWAHRSGF
jgi:hypothetical protein